jgi:hypothetical protein
LELGNERYYGGFAATLSSLQANMVLSVLAGMIALVLVVLANNKPKARH